MLLFFIAVAASYLLAFPTAVILRRFSVIDIPNARSSHLQPTLRGGGISIMVVVLVGFILVGFERSQVLPLVLAGAALLLALVSFVDDLKPVPVLIRFAAHALAAIVFLVFLAATRDFRLLPASLIPNVLLVLLLFFWIVGYTNAFNFMDGINGIAGGQAFITGLGTVLIIGCATGRWGHPLSACSLLLSGASLGFLPHNFPRARMFMGDVGSAPLGFLLSALAVSAAAEFGWDLLIPILLLHTNYILDTSITLARRSLRGERVYEAHKEHFYQRLVRAGKSHVFTTSSEMFLQILTLALLLLYVSHPGVTLHLIIGILVLLIWLIFFAYAEVVFLSRNLFRGKFGAHIHGRTSSLKNRPFFSRPSPHFRPSSQTHSLPFRPGLPNLS